MDGALTSTEERTPLTMETPDEDIELHFLLFFYSQHYGNTGCGVFKRGVQK